MYIDKYTKYMYVEYTVYSMTIAYPTGDTLERRCLSRQELVRELRQIYALAGDRELTLSYTRRTLWDLVPACENCECRPALIEQDCDGPFYVACGSPQCDAGAPYRHARWMRERGQVRS